MTTDRDHSELLLTAFRYVAGELPADDAAGFEALLSDDQSARDALADVVVLSEAVGVEEFERIHPLRSAPTPLSRRGIPGWAAVAAVCLVALISFLVFHEPDAPGPTDVAVSPADPAPLPEVGDAHNVLSLWSELGADDADRYESDPYLMEESLPPAPNEIPDWMLSAVVSGADEPPADMPDEIRELMDELDHENL